MSRAAGLAKVGFYATPPEALRRLCAMLAPETGTGPLRVLDPCAGEGEALAEAAQAIGAEPFAVEVQRDRAALCRQRFEHAIWGDAFRLRLSHHAFSLLWLNPPYDRQAAAKGGYELKFLRELDRALAPGGVLVYLIPRDRLSAASTYLSGHFEDVRVWRFIEVEYEPFRQVAVVARKRPTFIKDTDTQLQLMRWGAGWAATELPVLPEPGEATISVPRVPHLPDLLFASADIDTDALLELLNGKSAVWAHSAVQQKLWPSATYRARPLMPLRQGHLALLLAAGYLDNAVIPTPAGRLLVKGRISKDVVVVSVDEDAGKRVERERLNVALTALNADTGELRTYEGDGLGEFASEHRRELTEAVVRTFPAIYTIEHRTAMSLDALKRRPMGAQADVIRALAVSVQRRKGTICVGIPGTGKTYVASAVSFLAGCARTLIMCPPHLTRKWCREIEMTVPNARAMILRNPADLDTAMRLPARPDRPLFLVCSRETAKLGYRMRPSAIWRKRRLEGASRSRVTVERLCCPDCLGELEDKDGKPLDASELRGHKAKHLCAHCREMGGYQWECRVCWPDQQDGEIRKPCRRCCGGVLYAADPGGPRRQEIARYLAKRYPGEVDLFVCDEVHGATRSFETAAPAAGDEGLALAA
jgi:SAM-dependent methyltransferase